MAGVMGEGATRGVTGEVIPELTKPLPRRAASEPPSDVELGERGAGSGEETWSSGRTRGSRRRSGGGA